MFNGAAIQATEERTQDFSVSLSYLRKVDEKPYYKSHTLGKWKSSDSISYILVYSACVIKNYFLDVSALYPFRRYVLQDK
jgi:hypothetical protein